MINDYNRKIEEAEAEIKHGKEMQKFEMAPHIETLSHCWSNQKHYDDIMAKTKQLHKEILRQ
jgi:hypothetical protein